MSSLSELSVHGIDDDTRERLVQAGLATVEQLCDAGASRVAEVADLPGTLAEELIRVAEAWMIRQGQRGELVQLAAGSEQDHLARGLALARVIQSIADRAHQARLRVKSAGGGGRKKTRRELAHFVDVLQAVEADALRGRCATSFDEDVRAILADAEDRLDAALARKPMKPHRVKRLRKDVRHARHRLEALLSSVASGIERAANGD